MVDKSQPNYWLISEIREALGHMGAPYDMYLADDFDGVADKYKAIIVVQSVKTALSDDVIEKAEKKGIPLFVITSNKTTAEDLHKFCEDSGVHMYCNKKAVVYSSESYVFTHTGEDGMFDFTFDDKHTFTDVYTGKEITFPCELTLGKSFLFRRG